MLSNETKPKVPASDNDRISIKSSNGRALGIGHCEEEHGGVVLTGRIHMSNAHV